MTIDQLQAFVVAVREGSMSQGARYLFIGQSSLSRRIQTLETELGSLLVERRGNGIGLTEKGREFLPYAQEIVMRAEEAKRQINSPGATFASSLIVGATPSLAPYLLQPILHQPIDAGWGARITLRTGVSILHTLMQEGRVDLILSRSRLETGSFRTVLLFEEPLLAVCRPDHPLARARRSFSIAELAQFGWICSELGSQYWRDIERLVTRGGGTMRVVMDVDHCDIVKALVAETDCLAFLSESTVRAELAEGSLAALDIEGEPFRCPAFVTVSQVANHPDRDRLLDYLLLHYGGGDGLRSQSVHRDA